MTKFYPILRFPAVVSLFARREEKQILLPHAGSG